MVRVVPVGVALVVSLLAAGSGTPVLAQAKPQKLDFAYILAPPESGAVAFKWMAEEVTRRSHATLTVVFHGGTLLNKELEIMDAVKSGNVAIGSPSGAASTVFPELGVRSEEHTSELQSQSNLVCRLLLEKKKKKTIDSSCV